MISWLGDSSSRKTPLPGLASKLRTACALDPRRVRCDGAATRVATSAPAIHSRGVTADRPTQQHYLPQGYLAGFAAERSADSRLFVADVTGRRVFPSTPRKAGKER